MSYYKPLPVGVLPTDDNIRELTRVTFYEGVPLPSNMSDVMDFPNYELFDNYLSRYEKDEVFTSYQKLGQQVRINAKLEKSWSSNYIRIENNTGDTSENKIVYYGHITKINYLNDSTISVDWLLDPYHTFNPIANITTLTRGLTFVERSHENDIKFSKTPGMSTRDRILNTNPEPISRTTNLIGSRGNEILFDAKPFDPINKNTRFVRFAVYWLTKNFDKNGTNTTSSYPKGGLFAGVPSMSDCFIIPFNLSNGKTLPWTSPYGSDGSVVSGSGGQDMGEISEKLATAKDLNGERTLTNAYITDYFGIDFNFKGGIVDFQIRGTQTSWAVTKWSVNEVNDVLVMKALRGANFRKMPVGSAPVQFIRSQQKIALFQDGFTHKIRNIKTSQSPFAEIELYNGYGQSFSYSPELIDPYEPTKSMQLVHQSGLSMSQKTHTFIDNYGHREGGQPQFDNPTTDAYNSAVEIGHGLWNNEPQSLPIVSDTFTSTNALNANSNAMVFKSADIQRQNMNIGQDVARTNQNLSIDAQNQQMNNNINTSRSQSDLQSGAFLGNALGLDRGLSNTLAGGVKGAIGGIGGGPLGILTGAIGGGVGGAMNVAGQEMGFANQQANQAISNQLASDTLMNSQNAQSQITENNIQLGIESFQAKQADLRNAPDQYIQSGGDGLWNGQYGQSQPYFRARIESGRQIKATDLYFSAFGYSVGQSVKPMDFFNMANSRKKWNFIKTNGVHFVSEHIPSDSIKALEALFNQGVRIWHVKESEQNWLFMDTDDDNPDYETVMNPEYTMSLSESTEDVLTDESEILDKFFED